MRIPVEIILVHVFDLLYTIFWTFQITLLFWKACILLLTLPLTLMIFLLQLLKNCDLFNFPLPFSGVLLTELASFRLLSLISSTTDIIRIIWYCSGDIVFHFHEVSSNSYLFNAEIISSLGFMYLPSSYMYFLVLM